MNTIPIRARAINSIDPCCVGLHTHMTVSCAMTEQDMRDATAAFVSTLSDDAWVEWLTGFAQMRIAARRQAAQAREIWGCSGGCNQGRSACDCELSNEVAAQAEFPEIRTPADRSMQAIFWRYTSLAYIAMVFALFAFYYFNRG